MTLEQSFDGHGMIVPRSWNNLRSWARGGLYVNLFFAFIRLGFFCKHSAESCDKVATNRTARGNEQQGKEKNYKTRGKGTGLQGETKKKGRGKTNKKAGEN